MSIHSPRLQSRLLCGLTLSSCRHVASACELTHLTVATYIRIVTMLNILRTVLFTIIFLIGPVAVHGMPLAGLQLTIQDLKRDYRNTSVFLTGGAWMSRALSFLVYGGVMFMFLVAESAAWVTDPVIAKARRAEFVLPTVAAAVLGATIASFVQHDFRALKLANQFGSLNDLLTVDVDTTTVIQRVMTELRDIAQYDHVPFPDTQYPTSAFIQASFEANLGGLRVWLWNGIEHKVGDLHKDLIVARAKTGDTGMKQPSVVYGAEAMIGDLHDFDRLYGDDMLAKPSASQDESGKTNRRKMIRTIYDHLHNMAPAGRNAQDMSWNKFFITLVRELARVNPAYKDLQELLKAPTVEIENTDKLVKDISLWDFGTDILMTYGVFGVVMLGLRYYYQTRSVRNK